MDEDRSDRRERKDAGRRIYSECGGGDRRRRRLRRVEPGAECDVAAQNFPCETVLNKTGVTDGGKKSFDREKPAISGDKKGGIPNTMEWVVVVAVGSTEQHMMNKY